MKKINITTIALLVYLIVMSIIGWPGNNPGNNYTEYRWNNRRKSAD